MAVGAAVALDADAADVREQDDRALPDLAVQAGGGELVAGDGVGLAQQVQALLGDLADDADAEAGAGEGLALDDLVGQAELLADHADLVLEQLAQRLDELELDVVGEAADVVVRLDVRGAGAAAGLDDVRVQGALHEEGDRGAVLLEDLQLGLLEDADELAADDLPLGLRVGHAGEGVQEALLRVDDLQLHAGGGDEVLLDLLGLTLAHQAVVDVDAGQLGADGLLHEGRGDRGVHAAGQAADGALVADLRLDGRDLLLDDVAGRPGGGEAGAAVEEVLQDLLAVRGVHHLGVVLHAVQLLLVVLEGRHGYDVRRRGDGEALGGGGAGVAVRHPHGLVRRGALEEGGAGLGDGQRGAAVLAGAGVVDRAAEGDGHQLEAVAHAEDGDPGLEDGAVQLRGALLVDGGRAAGEDDRLGVLGQHLVDGHRARHDLAVDPCLADAAGDELGVLGAEVDDENRVRGAVVGGGGCFWHGAAFRRKRWLFCRF
ncbi:hypothetical protein GCM10010215_63780 [Streptomyces virginiae]|nr:hypothetical protein GCM10010215_63780 [Streptomyces virginiae]